MSVNPFSAPQEPAFEKPARRSRIRNKIRWASAVLIYLIGVFAMFWVRIIENSIGYTRWSSYDPKSWICVFGPCIIGAAVCVTVAAIITNRWPVGIAMVLISPGLFFLVFIIRLFVAGFILGMNGEWPGVE